MNLASLPVEELLRKRRGLRRQLLLSKNLQELRIAVLGGSTTNELADLWELLLLSNGFKPTFYQSEYGKYYDDAIFNIQTIAEFDPHLAYIHTSYRNILQTSASLTGEDFSSQIGAEFGRYQEIWRSLTESTSCQIIQNNFETPPYQLLGNLDSSKDGGCAKFLLAMNALFAEEASRNKRLLIQDIHAIAAQIGTSRWFDWSRWFSYKLLYTEEANVALAHSLSAITLAIYGRSKKVLVLDLDNTCWGGVIGDDGPDRIQIGRETPVAEAYTAFQEYCLGLRNRGILLAVCSKNDEALAKQGLEHPDSVLRFEHFSSFKANWDPKHENLLAIAKDLNLGVESFVFVDDNPAERSIVESQLPGVAVPDIGSDVTLYPQILDRARYFEPVSLSLEDIQRASLYGSNAQRTIAQAKFSNYDEYLESLAMEAEIAEFCPVYLERIAQLTNKTNQYNLTTRRYSFGEIEAIARDRTYLGLYGRLADRFGDNGLISVVVGQMDGADLRIDLWLMSCRVLKRNMEHAMLDTLVAKAHERGAKRIVGEYLPSAKNGVVSDHYARLGFTLLSLDEQTKSTRWSLEVAEYSNQNRHIYVRDVANGYYPR